METHRLCRNRRTRNHRNTQMGPTYHQHPTTRTNATIRHLTSNLQRHPSSTILSFIPPQIRNPNPQRTQCPHGQLQNTHHHHLPHNGSIRMRQRHIQRINPPRTMVLPRRRIRNIRNGPATLQNPNTHHPHPRTHHDPSCIGRYSNMCQGHAQSLQIHDTLPFPNDTDHSNHLEHSHQSHCTDIRNPFRHSQIPNLPTL